MKRHKTESSQPRRRGFVTIMMGALLLLGVTVAMATVSREASDWSLHRLDRSKTQLLDDAIASVERSFREEGLRDSKSFQFPVMPIEGQEVGEVVLECRVQGNGSLDVGAKLRRDGQTLASKRKVIPSTDRTES